MPCGRSCSRRLVGRLASLAALAGLAKALNAAPRDPGARRSTVSIYTHTHKHTSTDREINRQTDRPTKAHTHGLVSIPRVAGAIAMAVTL